MTPLLRLENLSKCYARGTSREVRPLNGINLAVARGERIVLLGKSGSGKSTVLNLVGGVDTPTSGRVLFDGMDLATMASDELARYRRKEVGFIFQSFNLFPTLTVGENLTLPLELLGVDDDARALRYLNAVGLEGQWDKFPEQLSGGEQQRVAIARALVKEPRLILADEPTGNLDLETGNSILALIDKVCRTAGATLIMATHSAEALWLADRTFRLRAGTLTEVPVAATIQPQEPVA
ncbi:MAG: ABC transporter ATP-binding protein [Desulfomonile tiedjei]|nr:ABC transporter ATP-binding protein [Desulfomonile tiedjei]